MDGRPSEQENNKEGGCPAVSVTLEEERLWERGVDEDTPVEELYDLADMGSWYVVAGVAQNPAAPPSLLEKIFEEEGAFIRSLVVDNPNCPTSILQEAARIGEGDHEDDESGSVAWMAQEARAALERRREDC